MKYNRLRGKQDYYRPGPQYGVRMPDAARRAPRADINGGLYKLTVGLSGMVLSACLLLLIAVSLFPASSGGRASPPELWRLVPEYEESGAIKIASFSELLDFSIFDSMGEPLPRRLPYIEPFELENPYMDSITYTHYRGNAGQRVSYGIDVSSRQGGINWFSVRRERIQFAMLRAGSRGYSEGKIYEDKAFDTNVRSASLVGIKTGAYFYSQAVSREEILEETEVILRRARGYKMEMPLVLDFEFADVGGEEGGRLYDAGLSVDEATEMCLLFCRTVRAAGYTPMIYANTNMLTEHLDAARLAQEAQIWIAYPAYKLGYDGVNSMWQYSWKGHIAGIPGEVDMDFGYSAE